ncbi:ABC transporter permease [Lachnotalea sp. AF33-28]|uniref:ABC transporter permease n=1 Tax=Lachnotalea sp. AF33-28 TaxID=2292046 RepID=UPI000E4913B0|nr:ABC transporter permease subunit [Lachnotalea sp. AF33-28]RHP29926.1 sugar ABC transporter permease [Lachnotalea sp. AF33-28]
MKKEKAALADVNSKRSLWYSMRRHKGLYLMALPGIIWFIMFKYVPLAGSVIAFMDYDIYKGIWGSKFVGLKHFAHFFRFPEFGQIFRNTAILGAYDVLIVFPIPIFLALLMNEVRNAKYKKAVQTAVYVPHFLSWVIVGGIFTTLLSPNTGIVNNVRQMMGLDSVYYMASEKHIRGIMVLASIWKGMGWSSIVYLAAISGIDPALYEAAEIDGANRFKRILHITLPTILPIIMTMLLLKIGNFMEIGFEKTNSFMNSMNQDRIDVFDTFVYRYGLQNLQYSYATAVGLFKSVIGIALLFLANAFSKKTTKQSII